MHAAFRSKFPGPTRTIGFQQFNDGSGVYIVSEPPARVDINSVDKVFDGYVHYIWTRRSPLGYDGYVKDLIIYTDGIPEICHDEIVCDLNRLVYGTDYKASVTPLPYSGVMTSTNLSPALNVTINDHTLRNLLSGEGKRFRNILTGVTTTVNEIAASQATGVYQGLSDDIVIWVLRHKEHINDHGRLFHIFALETDLLLGGVYARNKNDEGVVFIVGRKRQMDVMSIPPLRYDEMLTLASVESHLGQSLAITRPVYCNIEDTYNWCPGWMSPDIRNTEYGHLLTLTDIYLKFWLRGWEYDAKGYNSFLPRNKFNPALLDGYKDITFNWNTKDYIKATFFEDDIVIHFDNIGCLNCKIFDNDNDTEIGKVNTAAYEALRDVGSPEIMRVAQYTMLYSLLKLFDISAERPDDKGFTRVRDDVALYDGSKKILSRIRDLSDFEIDRIATSIYRNEILPQITNFSNEDKVRFMSDNPYVKEKIKRWDDALNNVASERAEELGVTLDQYRKEEEYAHLCHKADSARVATACGFFDVEKMNFESYYCMNIISTIENSRKFLCGLTQEQFDEFCRYCASDHEDTGFTNIDLMKNSERTLECKFILSRYPKHFGIDIKGIMDEYIARVDDRRELWLKTPNVVLIDNRESLLELNNSFSFRSSTVLGGHSIIVDYRKTEASSVSKGKEIIHSTGHPLDDALMYGLLAKKTESSDVRMTYFRKSKEALSQHMPRSGMSYSKDEARFYDKLYERIYQAIEEERPRQGVSRRLTPVLMEEIQEVKEIATEELKQEVNLSPRKKEAYSYVIKVADKEQVVLKAKPAQPEPVKQNPDSQEDDEIKELKKRLQRLRMTLAELKGQGV